MPVALISGEQSRLPVLSMPFGSVCAIAALPGVQPGRFIWSVFLAAAPITPCWFLTSSQTPPGLAPPAGLARACVTALAQGRIKVLRHHLAKPTAKQLGSMLAEFDYYAIVPRSLLVIDCADRWFGKPTRPGRPSLLSSLQEWAQRQQIAVVLIFHSVVSRGPDRATELLGYAAHLSGVARLAGNPGMIGDTTLSACHQLFWFAASSVTADVSLPLTTGTDGVLYVDDAARTVVESEVALDANTVIVQRSVLAGSGGAPAHWILCDTVDDVLVASAGARAATIILTFERTTPQDRLMQTVYRLRVQSGNRLKIIVREVLVRLRYNEEALIARLGGNLIVPMEVSYARFLSMMEMVQSQVFDAPLPATYEEALEDGLPQQEAGYLPPQVFASAVAATLNRSRALGIDNVLVRLTLGTGLSALDAMRHCTVKRAGDIYTCDRKSMLIFLFACRENDANQTLERIFALPVGELFSSEHRYISNMAAMSAIDDFTERAAGGRLPDLSEPLQQILALRAPAVAPGAMPAIGSTVPAPTAAAISSNAFKTGPGSNHGRPAAPRHTPLRLRPATADLPFIQLAPSGHEAQD